MILKAICVLWSLIAVTGAAHCPSDCPCAFPSLTKEDFCVGNFDIDLNPKYVPLLVTYLRYCYETMKEPNEIGSFRRHVLLSLLESATPVVHKAYFDSKTALKHVAAFTRVKIAVLEFSVYADSIESDVDPEHRWRKLPYRSGVFYSPGASCGSYVLRDDILLCQQLLNPCADGCGALNTKRLITVSKFTREILFPILNLTMPLQSDDAAYTIIDMYTLAKRCLGYTDVGSSRASAECDSILEWIQKEILPFLNPAEFDKTKESLQSPPRKPTIGFVRNPMLTNNKLK